MKTPVPVVEEGNEVVKPTRRAFLQGSGLAAGAAVVSGTTLATLAAHTARAGNSGHDSDQHGWSFQGYRSEYGSLEPTPDQNGDHILALPRDFQYVTFSKIGDRLSDGNICPRAHDGMTCLEGRGSVVRLIRNHEVRTAPGAFNDPITFSLGGPADKRYDPLGVGGTVTLDFDLRKKKLVRDFISLNGSIVNCSGGLAWRGMGWITSEETVAGPAQGWGKKHGYNFFVPVWANATVQAVPLPWMCRFAHEAAVADAR